MRPTLPILAVLLAGLAAGGPGAAADPPKLKILFLGDNAGHQPPARFAQLRPVFAARNIELTYTDKAEDLNPATLGGYDGLMVYANQTKITPAQEKALLDYVAAGKGFIPVHCASYCFLNSPAYIDLVGAQFRSHATGTFRTAAVQPDHPILKGYQSFTSFDETYVHHKHNEKDRTVLEVREESGLKEPWTWVRTHGKGRVFYTAWGHEQRTWGNPGFHNLLERGVRWACGQDPTLAGPYFAGKPPMTALPKGLAPFEYVPAKVPFYPGRRGEKADPIGVMQKPLPPAESVRHYVTPVGFEVRPFVTEEKLGGKPLAMAWDEKGRLWVSVTRDYPNERKGEGQGRDRIVVCTDADGDGVCDTVTTFADHLSIVTSLLPYAGGVIAHQAPVTLFLKDTDGDGAADVRQELFRGWSTGDTHAGPSNLHYGFDNWVYGSVGYAGFVGTVGGERMNFRQGFYRFKVEPTGANPPFRVAKMEFLRSTSNNTWGLNFDEAGELFGSTANGCPLVHMPIPNRYTEKVRGLSAGPLANIAADNHMEPITDKVRQVDFHGGFTAASHVALYTARTYPREYWNRTAFVSEPTGHLTAAFTLRPTGATFAATYGWNLVASDDEWASPIDAQVGPDGNMWVNDWYNFIVQHNPTPAGFKTGPGNAYETELRDKTHGRIYRVVYAGKADPRPDLAAAPPEKLVEALKHPNLGWRLHAQRLLVARGQRDIEPALLKLVQDRSVDDTGLNAGAVHAVWTLSGLLGPTAAPEGLLDLATAGLTHPSAAVRRATYLGLVSKWVEHGDALVPSLAGRSPFADPDAS
ncbi:MAG TPA: PVC-type heme-binding CxxCH protein, partial [Urbifossiella sp.]|nr:PVC-type heme-binding CxxCH protein [Urbifossiella sp.]